MENIKFNLFVDKIKEELETATGVCYENNYIDTNLKYRVFDSTGNYISYLNKETNSDETEDDILVMISNGGGLNNNEASIDTYMQLVNVDFQAKVEYREDLFYVLQYMVGLYKHKLIDFDNHYTLWEMPNLPVEGKVIQSGGSDKIKMSINFNILIYAPAYMDQDIILKINGDQMIYKNLKFSRTNILKSNNIKATETKFYANSSVLVITFDAIYLKDDDMHRVIYLDTLKPSNVNKSYNVQIFDKDSETPILDEAMVAPSIDFNVAYGKLVSFNMTLRLYISI